MTSMQVERIRVMTTTTKTKSETGIKISKRTLDILKNFSTINSGILVNEGNVLTTLSSTKNILAEAHVDETFPRQFAIWDLNKFLGTVSLFKDPDFVFDESFVTVKSGGSSVRYYYCAQNLVTSTNKKITMPDAVVQFDLKSKDFSDAAKAASVLQVQHLCVRSSDDGEKIELAVVDKTDTTSNFYSIQVGDNTSGATFEFIFDVENLKILPGDYSVSISQKIVSCFASKTEPLKYWIALNGDSSYEA
jgi:hypothetical protein